MASRIVDAKDLDNAMLEYEAGTDDRVPFTQDEADAMAADPCAFGYHLWSAPDDPDYEGLCCARGCGYAIG